MPQVMCSACKKFQPIKWDAIARRWFYWPHGPEDKRCPNSEKPAVGP